MKIGFYSPYLDSLAGGERYVLTLASHWAGIHDVDVFWDDQAICKRAGLRLNLDLSRVTVVKNIFGTSDLFSKLQVTKKYDFIFANPPYVAENRKNEVQKSVLDFESKKALFAGSDGLLFIKKFLKDAKSHLKKGGKIYLEFDPRQKDEIKKILTRYSYSDCHFFKDQYGKWRYLTTKA